MKATIYIPEEKANLYEKAKTELGDSISATFVRCLEREIESKRIQMGRLVAEVTYPEGRRSKKAFEGRWIVGNASHGENHVWEETESSAIRGVVEYSVALTKKGAIVVCVWNRDEEIVAFTPYEDFEAFSTAEDGGYNRYPPSLVAAVASELGIDHVEDLDI